MAVGGTYYAVIDCDNCFVSCERVFRPDLNGKAVVVLSNNDGCVVARSNEAKQLGIKAGMPFYKLRSEFRDREIAVFSGNHELYGELTQRVMSLLQAEGATFVRYSIDEAFLIFGDRDGATLKLWGEGMHNKIMRHVGIPVSIGIAPNKTLAKMASHFAKRYANYHHCCAMDTEEKRIKALKLVAIDDVWGIGRRNSVKMHEYGIATAYDFSVRNESWVRSEFNITGLRTWRELHGEDSIETETPSLRKSIRVSRSFDGMISDYEVVRMFVAEYASLCAEKLRRQHTFATAVGVFIDTNRFRTDLQQYSNYEELRLLTPTDSSIVITQTATACLEKMWREGLQYKRAGVVVASTDEGSGIQTNLVDFDSERYGLLQRLDRVIDSINKQEGKGTIVLGSQPIAPRSKEDSKPEGASRQEFRSPCYTTRWSDIIELH